MLLTFQSGGRILIGCCLCYKKETKFGSEAKKVLLFNQKMKMWELHSEEHTLRDRLLVGLFYLWVHLWREGWSVVGASVL